jgi:ABC-type cobalamin/Fe3+-siderophores transport system ATPase subunit/soluble cytochrome b562
MRNRYQKSNPFPRGSRWRKWDLHVHAPGTKLNDNYEDSDEGWKEFCQVLAESDVEAFGITDYFSLETFFRCRELFHTLHPESKKVLFPNVELRLNESVNKDAEPVELHIVMASDLDERRGATLLANLATEINEPGGKRKLPSSELETEAQFASASVTREAVSDALERTFGPEQIEDPHDYLLLVPANHGGLRCDLGEKRKVELASRIDEMTHAVFGSEINVEHFLDLQRTKGANKLPPKPVLGGSDAHSIQDLRAWLGREVDDGKTRKTPTWIKADMNFNGLLQIRAEPQGRVRLGAAEPDPKDPYRVIESVHFSGTEDFPAEIKLNPNLVAVIGPRSSGKSSLLAHIAHEVDAPYTVSCQEEVEPRPKRLGPAPGKTWDDVAELEVEVRWRDPEATEGKVVYVPQNALHSISGKVDEIADRIEPALREGDPAFDTAIRTADIAIDAANEEIELAVRDWFSNREKVEKTQAELRDRGEKEAIIKRRDELAEQIADKREENKVSEKDAKDYEETMDRLGKIEGRIAVIDEESHRLSAYLRRDGETLVAEPTPKVEVRLTPGPGDVPEPLRETLREIAASGEAEAVAKVGGALVSYQEALDIERTTLSDEEAELKKDNKELIERNEANSEIEELAKARRRQEELLEQVEADEKGLAGLGEEASEIAKRVSQEIAGREAAIAKLVTTFKGKDRARASMVFGIEAKFDPDLVAELEGRFNRNTNGPFLGTEVPFSVERCHSDAEGFMAALRNKEQKLRAGQDPCEVAEAVLGATPKALFWADIEGDRIGGYESSSMSPGKQALFALELILDDSDEPWPLLIDQPEDDLDSRSISTQLVRYLVERKVERQIIMVSHDANLVIGADAEQVIVANRHGVKTENAEGRTFDYFSGSLEHSRERRTAPFELEQGGIREHACDILDGGEEAFRKRRRKYQIS